jgi:hypothetical protein
VPIIDFRYLSGPVTVKLNWDDPWYSRFENPNLKRHHESALMSYLYVEPREVRHEVVTRIKDLENWIDLGLRGDRYIEPDEWATLQARVAEFFLSKNKVAIDGESVDLAVDRTSFLALGLQGVQALEQPERLEISTAIVGVALAYAIEAMPDEVTVDWELFSDEITRVPSTAVDPAGPFMSFADPDDPVIVWRNFLVDYREPAIEAVPLGFDRTLGLPLLSVVLLLAAIGAGGLAFKPRLLPRKAWLAMVPAGLLGAGLLSTVAVLEVENPLVGPPDQAATAEIVERLVGNLHAALEERDESRSRDALTVSVSEQALGAVLPELRRGLVIEIQGGRSARVGAIDEIVVKELQGLDAGAGFRALAEWSADASGWHWQHLHRRRMRFTALMDVMPVGDAWKLTGLTVISVQQES